MTFDLADIDGLHTPAPLKNIVKKELAELKYGTPILTKQALGNVSTDLEKEVLKGELEARTALAEGKQIEYLDDEGLSAQRHSYTLGWNAVVYGIEIRK